MLQLRLQASLVAIALCLATPVHAQSGLDGRLDAAEQKLAQDTQSCTAINLGEYADLLREAAENKVRANKAAKKGIPVDQAKVDADLAKASNLFNRAMGALVGQCLRHAQQAQPPGTSARPMSNMDVLKTYFAARRQCDLGGMASAVSNKEWWLDFTTQAKLIDYPGDVKRCASEGPTGSGTSPTPPYDPTYVAQPQLGTGQQPRQAQSIDPEGHAGSTWMADPASVGGPLSPFANEVLAAHNATRAEYGAPPLKWDDGLALRAGNWAGELAKIGRLEHSPREGRGTERENLAQVPVNWSDAQTFGRWAGEKADFVPGTFPNVCRSGGMCDGVLHITQMIWPTTTALGCGKAIGQGYQFVVCYYNPGGNKDGKIVGIKPTTILPELDTKVAQPTLPPTEVFRPTTPKVDGQAPTKGVAEISANLRVDQAWGGEQLTKAIDQLKASTAGGPPRRDAALFDLGIYAGGAWTTDWFEIGGASPPDVGYPIGDLQVYLTFPEGTGIKLDTGYGDYGYDSQLFVGYDLGAFRIESEVAYKKAEQAIDWGPIEDLLFRGSWAEDIGKQGPYGGGGGPIVTIDTYRDYDSEESAGPGDTYADSVKPPQCVEDNIYRAAAIAIANLESATKIGDADGITKAKAALAAAIARQRGLVDYLSKPGQKGDPTLRTEADALEQMNDHYEKLTGEKAPAGQATAEIATPTNVQQPDLPPKEVFNPADLPKCNLEIM